MWFIISYILPFPCLIEPRIRKGLHDTPVVLILEPRQAGKTIIARQRAGATLRCLSIDIDAWPRRVAPSREYSLLFGSMLN